MQGCIVSWYLRWNNKHWFRTCLKNQSIISPTNGLIADNAVPIDIAHRQICGGKKNIYKSIKINDQLPLKRPNSHLWRNEPKKHPKSPKKYPKVAQKPPPKWLLFLFLEIYLSHIPNYTIRSSVQMFYMPSSPIWSISIPSKSQNKMAAKSSPKSTQDTT